MKYSKVLNRPMFNKHNSAYGRGIASNLVSDEERQRFNYGGRVRAAEGLWSSDWYKEPEMTWEGPPYVVPGLGHSAPQTDEEKLAIQKDIIEGGSPQDRFWEGELEEARLGTSDKYKTGKEGIGLIEKETESAGPDMETETLDIEEDVWSPQEKKEKMGQMQLAMAERLIGGSRDKWGSTAQMKNLAGAIGDVRKITDKSEDRAMRKKYKAWGKAQADRDLATLQAQQKINTSEASLLNKHIEQPLSFKVTEILKIKNVNKQPPIKVGQVPHKTKPGKMVKGTVLDETKLEQGVLYADPNDPNVFIVVDKQGIPQRLSSTTDIIEARTNKLIE